MTGKSKVNNQSIGADEAFSGRLFLWCVFLGIMAGLGAIAFYTALGTVSHFLVDRVSGFHAISPAHEPELFRPSSTPFRPLIILIIPAIGGLASGWIAYRFAPETAGHGTDASIEAYHFHGGRIRARVPLVKSITSALTIGSGGSAGAEGPITQIGAGIGSSLADHFNLSMAIRRRLMAAGMAAGIAAIFRAPLAGAVFASEVLYEGMDIEHEILVPAFISSVTAYSVFAFAFGWDPLFAMPEFVFDNPARLLIYFLLALIEGGAAVIFIRLFDAVHDAFARLKMPFYWKPALGGAIVGLLGCFFPQALGTGYGLIQEAFLHDLGWSFLTVAILAKMASTSFSIGSGGSGGLFGPSLVIGCMIGRLVGQGGAWCFPFLNIHGGSFALVGMVGFLSAATNCPVSALLFAGEITGNYRLIVPSMLVCVTSYAITRRHSLYRSQVRSRLHAPANIKSMMTEVLKSISVEWTVETLRLRTPHVIPDTSSLAAVMDKYKDSDEVLFPVTDSGGSLCGVVEARDLRRLLTEAGSLDGLIVHDLSIKPVTVIPSDSLYDVIQAIQLHDRSGVIVVEEPPSGGIIAIIDPSTVAAAYNQVLAKKEV